MLRNAVKEESALNMSGSGASFTHQEPSGRKLQPRGETQKNSPLSETPSLCATEASRSFTQAQGSGVTLLNSNARRKPSKDWIDSETETIFFFAVPLFKRGRAKSLRFRLTSLLEKEECPAEQTETVTRTKKHYLEQIGNTNSVGTP